MKKGNIFLIISILAILILGYLGYSFLSKKTPTSQISSTEEEELFGKEFVSIIRKLETLSIDSEFFEDEIFKSLVDLSFDPGEPEEIGKDNPFLPLESSGSSESSESSEPSE